MMRHCVRGDAVEASHDDAGFAKMGEGKMG